MATRSESLTSIDPRTVGALIAIFSVGMAILVLFALPMASYLASIELMISFLGLIAGIGTMIYGQVRVWRRRSKSS